MSERKEVQHRLKRLRTVLQDAVELSTVIKLMIEDQPSSLALTDRMKEMKESLIWSYGDQMRQFADAFDKLDNLKEIDYFMGQQRLIQKNIQIKIKEITAEVHQAEMQVWKKMVHREQKLKKIAFVALGIQSFIVAGTVAAYLFRRK